MDFLKKLQLCIKRINNVLNHFIEMQPLQNTSLLKAMRYGTLLGGKRLRPFLVYTVGEMCKVNKNTLDTLAAVVEFIHSYSLIHDDLPSVDNSNLRRGLPACHIKYGEANAILAGNALQSLAFSILSSVPMRGVSNKDRLLMISELSEFIGISGMCGGQALDFQSKENKLTLQEFEFIYRCKTTSLIRVAIRLSILSANKCFRYILPILDNYAEYIGLAFQIQDDILDVVNKTELKNIKNTYLSLLGLDQAREKSKNLINDACKLLKQPDLQSFDTSLLTALAKYVIYRNK